MLAARSRRIGKGGVYASPFFIEVTGDGDNLAARQSRPAQTRMNSASVDEIEMPRSEVES